MGLFTISLNQFIEASKSTERGRAKIVQQQLDINKLLIPWYQLAKNRIKLYFKNVHDFNILSNAIADLHNKAPQNDRGKIDVKVSIEAIEKVINMRFDNILVGHYDVIKVDIKSIIIENIVINISPDLVYRYEEDNVKKLGALKFHVSKNKHFDLQQCKDVANLLKLFLEQNVKKEGEVVDEKLCWGYDVFGERLVQAEKNITLTAERAKELCAELTRIYGTI